MGRFIKNPVLTQGSSVEIPGVSTANRPTGANGKIIFNTTTSTYQVYNGSAWYNVSEASREKSLTVDKFQGDGSTTVFGAGEGNTLDGSTMATLSVVPTDATDMVIFVGGIYQIPTTNYTYSGGQITFGSPIPANDGTSNGHIVTIIHNLHKLGE
jgi:hypothetical protein|tara:strand:+ start:1227 stop:1691 length:465 start_codon:yes stop_codon:yes gene_type:complete